MIDRDSKRVCVRRVNDGTGHFDDMVTSDPDGPYVEFDDYDKVCSALESLSGEAIKGKKKIHGMKLHDMIGYNMTVDGDLKGQVEDNLTVTRVPGGWIYTAGMDRSACFVPYSEEFKGEG